MASEIKGGATLWARQTVDSDIFCDKPDKWFKIWFYLVNRVNYKDVKRFKRGECFLKYENIMEATGATYNQVDSFLRWARSAEMLTTRKTTRGIILEIANYSHFQTLDNYYDDVKTETETETKPKRNRNTTETIVEERKERKEDIAPLKTFEELDIKMTITEYDKLVTNYGKAITDEYLERLDAWLKSTGKRKKSHYSTIISWFLSAGIKKKKSAKEQLLELAKENGLSPDQISI